MAYSRVYYNALAGQRDFDVTFDKLERDHVRVYVNGDLRTDWVWFNETRIQFGSGLTAGDVVLIERNTSQQRRIVDYEPPSSLNEKDLDDDSLQAFYMAQEALDKANAGIVDDPVTGHHTAANKRITNVADPVGPQDAATNKQIIQTHARIDQEIADREWGDAVLHAKVDGMVGSVERLRDQAAVFASRAEAGASESELHAQQAHQLVEAATAGFTGFDNNSAYDFGWVNDPMTYFNRDFGTI